jgi:hypothetical protein
MANRKLLLCNINELKQKFTHFYFSDGGYFDGYGSIDLIKNDTEIKCIYYHTLEGKNQEFTFSEENWDKFIDKLFIENIHKWKKEYIDKFICDGEQWELKIEFNGLPSFESSGSNKYPDNWDKFLEIINEYFPQMG